MTAIEPVKRFIGPVGGSAVRSAPASDTVGVAEGIETGRVLSGGRPTPNAVVLCCQPAAFASSPYFQATFSSSWRRIGAT